MSGLLSYMDIPGIYIRNGVSKMNGEDFDDITDWGGSFIEKVRAALLALRSGKQGNGKTLVDGIASLLLTTNRKITIEPAKEFGGQEGSGWDGASLLRWCPDEMPNTGDDWDQLNGIPAFIILGHELIHAMHTLRKDNRYGKGYSNDIAIEEARTIGLGPWKDSALTENGLRQEWGLKPRTTFQGATAERLLTGTGY